MVIYGIPADVKGFAEGELSQPSDKFVGGKSTMEKATYWGPGTPPNTDWHHYTFILMATDLDPKALEPGYDARRIGRRPPEPCKGLGRFGHPVQAPVTKRHFCERRGAGRSYDVRQCLGMPCSWGSSLGPS